MQRAQPLVESCLWRINAGTPRRAAPPAAYTCRCYWE